MKEIGKGIEEMAKDMSVLKMAMSIKDNLKMVFGYFFLCVSRLTYRKGRRKGSL